MTRKRYTKSFARSIRLKNLSKIVALNLFHFLSQHVLKMMKTDASATGSQGIRLKDDQIVKHISILNGFDAVPSKKKIELLFEDN